MTSWQPPQVLIDLLDVETRSFNATFQPQIDRARRAHEHLGSNGVTPAVADLEEPFAIASDALVVAVVNGITDRGLEWTPELRAWLVDRISERLRAKAAGCASAFARTLRAEAARDRIDRTFRRYAHDGISMGGIWIDRAVLRSRRRAHATAEIATQTKPVRPSLVRTQEPEEGLPAIFVCYSHADKGWKERVMTHLGVVDYRLETWDDRCLKGGSDWFAEIEQAIKRAKMVIFLVSADSLTSPFVRREEVPRLLERRQYEGLTVIPVIVRACLWQEVPWLRGILARPPAGAPLAGMSPHQAEAALADLAKDVRYLLRKVPAPRDETVAASRAPASAATAPPARRD